MFGIVHDIISDLNDDNEKLKKKLKEVTEAMTLLAALAGPQMNKDIPWARLAEEARQLYENSTGK